MALDSLSGEDGAGAWPAFADLLAATTLLFVVLFAVITVPAIDRAGKAKALETRLDSLAARLPTPPDSAYVVERMADHLRITVGDHAVFTRNQSTLDQLNPAGLRILEALATRLRMSAVLNEIDQIHVVGHTSAEGTDERNWVLSSERATTIALFLLDRGDLPACKITALGRGRFYPRRPELAQQTGRIDGRDRRIELELRPRVEGDSTQERRRRGCVEVLRRPRIAVQ